MAKPSKSKKKASKRPVTPEDLQRARRLAAGLEASFTVPPPPGALAPAPFLDELRDLGAAGVQGLTEHLAATSPGGRVPTLAAVRELGDADAVPALLVHARALRWPPDDLAALGETIRTLAPEAELPAELEPGVLGHTRQASARLAVELDAEGAAEVCELLRGLPPRLRELSLRGVAGEGGRPASLLSLARAMAERGVLAPALLIDAIASLETKEAAQALAGLEAGTADKETSSRLRKALYRLRSRGIEAEEKEKAAGAPAAAAPAPGVDFAMARISAVDGMGRMMVWIARSLQPRGRFVVEAMLRRGHGIEDFATADLGAKELREVLARISDPAGHLATCEVPLGYAVWLLQRAQREAEREGQALPAGFTRGKLLLGPLGDPAAFPPDDAHPVLRHVQPPAPGEPRIEPRELFEQRAFWSWLIEERKILPHLRTLVDSLQSNVALSEAQRRERLDQIVSDAAKALFADDPLRSRTAGAFEDNAFFFHFSGQPGLARECLALAGEMRAVGGEPPAFFREMVHLSLSVMLDRLARQAPAEPGGAAAGQGREGALPEEGGEGGGSPIITP